MTTTIEKILAKAAELEQQAAALRLAAGVLNGHAHAEKRATAARTVAKAIRVRRVQKKNGTAAAPEAPAGERLSPWQQTEARRAQKRTQIVGLVRDYGKPMPIAELVTAARAHGIPSLTGMISYVRAGFLRKSGARGKTRYTFRQMPEETRSTRADEPR